MSMSRTCKSPIGILLQAWVRRGRWSGWLCQVPHSASVHGCQLRRSHFACKYRHGRSVLYQPFFVWNCVGK